MALTTKIYLGRYLENKNRFVEIVNWCCDNLGLYGDNWSLDWDEFTIHLSEKNAVMFILRWAQM